jgi:hypothetical protein
MKERTESRRARLLYTKAENSDTNSFALTLSWDDEYNKKAILSLR